MMAWKRKRRAWQVSSSQIGSMLVVVPLSVLKWEEWKMIGGC
jgi:hypothetical protein